MQSILRLIQVAPILFRYGVWEKYRNTLTQGQRLRLALQRLGPIYIKFGQVLSTRRDLLSDDMANELAKLQDQVPAFSGQMARALIKNSLGQPVDALFNDFEDTALGSASIAQVHGATLLSGEAVVIKILRPNIQKLVARDIALLGFLARGLEATSALMKQLRIHDVVEEFKQLLDKELDLNYEAANASQLKRNMAALDWVIIPSVHWPYIRKDVAVFERIHATPIHHKQQLLAQGIDLSLLAERTIELFFTALFEHNFFHADMHPGNIFIKKIDEDIKYVLVDFGIMGTLDLNDQRYLAENLAAFFAQDYTRVAQLHVDSGWVPSTTRVDEFAATIRTLCEPLFARGAQHISFAQLFSQLLCAAKQYNMAILPQLILLEKTLVNVEGVAKMLDAEVDIWDTAKPFLTKWFKQQSGVRALRAKLRTQSPFLINRLLELPQLVLSALERAGAAHGPVLSPTERLRERDVARAKKQRRSVAAGLIVSVTLGAIAWFYM